MNRLITALLALALAACATTTNEREADPLRAAQLNAELALRFLEQGDLPLAKSKVERALDQDPRNALANNVNGLVQQRLGDEEAAERGFQRAMRYAPDQPEYANAYGVYLCQVGRAVRGMQVLERTAENPLFRDPAGAWENAATCAQRAGERERAERYLERALALQPGRVSARLAQAEIHYADGRYHEALAQVQALEEADQMSAAAAAMGARAAARLRRPELTRHYVSVLRERYPDSYQARALSQQ